MLIRELLLLTEEEIPQIELSFSADGDKTIKRSDREVNKPEVKKDEPLKNPDPVSTGSKEPLKTTADMVNKDAVPELDYSKFNKNMAAKINKNRYSTPRTAVSKIIIKESKDDVFNVKDFEALVAKIDKAVTDAVFKESEAFLKSKKYSKHVLTVSNELRKRK